MIRVIVVDDEYKVCQLICQLIQWEELDMELIGTASNGTEALQMIEVEKPDLVITDIRMPGYDGLELLKRAQEFQLDLEFIIISGHSHFEYARTAIQYGVSDYILKPINQETLNATLMKAQKRYIKKEKLIEASHKQKVKQKEDEAKIRDMLWRDVELQTLGDDIGQINNKYHYHFQKGLFQIFLIRVDLFDNKDMNILYTNHVLDLLHSKVVLFLEKLIRPLCIEVETFYKEGQIIGILNYFPEKQQKMREELLSLGNLLSMELQVFEYIRLHLSLSKVTADIRKISNCFDEAERAMGQRLFSRDHILLEEIPEDIEFERESLYKTVSMVMKQGMDIQSPEKINESIQILEKEAFKLSLNGRQQLQLVKDAYRIFLLSSVFQNEYNFADKDEKEAEFDERVKLCSDIKQVYKFLCENAQKDLEDARVWEDKEKNRPIVQAEQYIKENYRKALSLDEVSSQVGFSVSYFSTLFRKRTGKTFLEYLMDIRIEQAKILLRETRGTIESICREVGCNDYKRFSKTFKKVTGVSPKEYRGLYS
jgi:Response regulator containing CheY-like receiver domain and AraC-type DNA-binding domain